MTGIPEILNVGASLLDKLIPDKIERDKLKLKMAELQQNGEFRDEESRYKAIITEAQSADKWTSRARPSFMYVMYAMILAALPMGVLSAFNPEAATMVANGAKMYLESIPDGLWVTFGVGYGGYSYFRTKEKSAIINSK